MVTVSIVIITWNGKFHLQKCLSSLAGYSKRPGVEVILVDNGSSDGTVDWVKKTWPDVRLVALEENKGVAYARNRGLELATGDYLLILDNDTVVTEATLDGMVQYMEEHYTEMLSAEVLAAAGGVSRPYLFALFREHLHSSPHRWLLRKRLNRARLLLAGGEEPVKFIAAECGFESLEVFYRQFRQNVGIPPAEYRRRYRPYPVS